MKWQITTQAESGMVTQAKYNYKCEYSGYNARRHRRSCYQLLALVTH